MFHIMCMRSKQSSGWLRLKNSHLVAPFFLIVKIVSARYYVRCDMALPYSVLAKGRFYFFFIRLGEIFVAVLWSMDMMINISKR